MTTRRNMTINSADAGCSLQSLLLAANVKGNSIGPSLYLRHASSNSDESVVRRRLHGVVRDLHKSKHTTAVLVLEGSERMVCVSKTNSDTIDQASCRRRAWFHDSTSEEGSEEGSYSTHRE